MRASSTSAAAPERAGGDTWRQIAAIKAGIGGEDAKRLQTLIKQNKLKVQASIQGDTLRVSGAKKDDLQATMALLRKEAGALPIGFKNFQRLRETAWACDVAMSLPRWLARHPRCCTRKPCRWPAASATARRC